jgi:hypothetical protein
MPKIPKNIRQQLFIAQTACDELEKIAANSGHSHKFTLDGRFVGDIGELIAAQHFDLQIHKKQKHCHDGICNLGGEEHGVQIKCRRKSTVIDFYSQPKLLLVIGINDQWTEWEIIYNGCGDFLTDDEGFSADEKGRLLQNGKKHGRRIYLDDLRSREAKFGPHDSRVPLKNCS